MRLSPARCRRHSEKTILIIQFTAAESDVSGISVPDFMPLAQMCSNPLFNMFPDAVKSLAAIPEVKISSPTAKQHVNLFYYAVYRDNSSFPSGQPGYSGFDGLERFLRWFNVRISSPCPFARSHTDVKPEKMGS